MRRAKWIVSRDRSGYYEIRRKTKAGERKLARLYDILRWAENLLSTGEGGRMDG